MIGQTKLKSCIETFIATDSLPHFIIFIGPKGCGKKTFVGEMFKGIYIEDNKVESVRKLIDLAYQVHGEIFIIPDADDMSVNAKNALLKVVEECPNDNRFIMTLQDRANTLNTILSRACVFDMDTYSSKELFEYYWSLEGTELLPHGMPNDAEIVSDVCDTPGDVLLIVKYGVTEFVDYVKLVLDNIGTVDPANAFKSSNKLAIKNDEGYDLRLFFLVFCFACIDYFVEGRGDQNYVKAIQVTSKYIPKLEKLGVNRQQLYDSWVFDIREALWT